MSVAAGLATIEALQSNNGEAYQQMESLGAKLMEGLKSIASNYGTNLLIQGLGSVFHPIFGTGDPVYSYRDYLKGDNELKNQFYAKLQSAGTRVTARGTWFLSTAHTDDDINETLAHVEKAWSALSDDA